MFLWNEFDWSQIWIVISFLLFFIRSMFRFNYYFIAFLVFLIKIVSEFSLFWQSLNFVSNQNTVQYPCICLQFLKFNRWFNNMQFTNIQWKNENKWRFQVGIFNSTNISQLQQIIKRFTFWILPWNALQHAHGYFNYMLFNRVK